MSKTVGILASDRKWFFDLYNKLDEDASSIRPLLEQKINLLDGIDDTIEVALILYLVALHAQATGDKTLVLDDLMVSPCDRLVAQLESEIQPSLNEYSNTWMLAVWSCTLRNINVFLKRTDISKLISGVKNHMYANCTREGMLMSSSDRETLGFDVLFASVPMGLFDTADLTLVEAINLLVAPARLEKATQEELLLLSWYYAEHGNYEKARNLLSRDTSGGSVKSIVARKLKSLGQLRERFIRHVPFGNGNRYEPLVEERFPKLVTEKDTVVVRAQVYPFSKDDPIDLVTGDTVILGEIRSDSWEFSIPAMPAGTECAYYLRFAKVPHEQTETFHYPVLKAQKLGRVLAITAEPNRIHIKSENCTIKLSTGAGDQFDIDIQPGIAQSITPIDTPNQHSYRLKEFSVDITLSPFMLTIARDEKVLFSTLLEGVVWHEGNDGKVHQVQLALSTSPCGIYGLGERYNALNQYGNRVDQYVYNQYKDQGLRTYIPMPVFYTDNEFGFHIDTDTYSWFEFAVTEDGEIVLGAEETGLSLQLLTGSINQQASQFIARTGSPELVPDWALGPWMSSNNWDSDAEVRRQVALSIENGIPATVLVIEAWSDEATFHIFNDAVYDETDGETPFEYKDFHFPEWGRWPDPKGLVEHLHQNDLKCILWQIPVVKQITSLTHIQKNNDEATFVRKGYGVKNADGTPYRLPEGWFKDSLLLDFTNPEATRWWLDKRQYLIDELRIDGFKTDGGECIFGNDLIFADGSTGLTMRNKYPKDYISAHYELAQQNGGITFSRSGYTGAQSFPAHWAGDERSTWDAFKRTILAGLSSGMSGVIFWGWDLGGFSGPIPSAELFIRSAQMACFCPIMQYHAESKAEFNQDRTPWNIAERTGDERALNVYRFYANLRMSLMPYLTREARHCVDAKTPLMRAMILDYQLDPDAHELWDQYLFGRDLLVAPVIREGDTSRTVYLPEGRWWHLFESKWYEGGTHTVDAQLGDIPVFVREGATIPLAFDKEFQLGGAMPSSINSPAEIALLVVGRPEGQYQFEEEDGGTICITSKTGGVIQIETSGTLSKNYTLVFVDAPTLVSVNDSPASPHHIKLAAAPLFAISLQETTNAAGT